jgi:hypothetical protein
VPVGFGRSMAVALGASIALVAIGAPVMASGNHNGSVTAGTPVANGTNSAGSCPFVVTNLQVVGPVSFPVSSLTLAITVYDTGNKTGTWYFPDPSLVSNSSGQLLPTIDIANAPPQDQGLNPSSLLLVNGQIPSVEANSDATADYTYQLPVPLQEGTYTVSLVPNNAGHVFHMYNGKNENGSGVGTAPVCLQSSPPVGELPEVPFAAGIPLVGIGVGAFLWYRRRQVPQPPQA